MIIPKSPKKVKLPNITVVNTNMIRSRPRPKLETMIVARIVTARTAIVAKMVSAVKTATVVMMLEKTAVTRFYSLFVSNKKGAFLLLIKI